MFNTALVYELTVLRPLTKGRVIAVFGCAGERDPARRDGMGRAAGELADYVVLTNEDPRSEDPRAITDDIGVGWRGETEEVGDFVRILTGARRCGRRKGGEGDLALLAGARAVDCRGAASISWDERVVARELLAMGWRERVSDSFAGGAAKRLTTEFVGRAPSTRRLSGRRWTWRGRRRGA
jgi:UDP-N-acetylmuramoyl-L-alanyl-D-glutamate--2,6-diaminopimelate ligase